MFQDLAGDIQRRIAPREHTAHQLSPELFQFLRAGAARSLAQNCGRLLQRALQLLERRLLVLRRLGAVGLEGGDACSRGLAVGRLGERA